MAESTPFILYAEYWLALSILSDEQRGKLLQAFFHEGGAGASMPELDQATQGMFLLIQQRIRANREKYEAKRLTNKANGSLGGRPRNPEKPNGFHEEPNGFSEKPLMPTPIPVPTLEENHPADDMSASSADCAGQSGEPEPETGPPDCPHETIIALYHEALPELARVSVWNHERKRHLRARWREVWERLRKRGVPHDAEALRAWWQKYFVRVKVSPFLIGHVPDRNGKAFFADLEWLVLPKNFAKVVDGKYLDRPPHPRAA